MKAKSIGLPDLFLRFRVTMPESGLVVHEHGEVGHSWTRNAWNAWNAHMMDAPGDGQEKFGPGYMSVRGFESNNIRSHDDRFFGRSGSSDIMEAGFQNPDANDNYGIVVGACDDPFLVDDYCLYELISHGDDPGRLQYNSQAAPVLAFDSGSKKWSNTITRVFNNNSGGAITIKEAGLVYDGFANLWGSFLMARDVLEVPVEVPNGGQLTVDYVITSVSFAPAEEKALPMIAPGTPGSGGFYIGTLDRWDDPNHIYFMIVSPIEGETEPLVYADPTYDVTETTNTNYGRGFSEELIALGEESPLGEALQAYRDATGMQDWYIPTRYEVEELIAPNHACMPAEHEFADQEYWSTYAFTSDRPYVYNWLTGSGSLVYQHHSYPARFVRRIKYSEWNPD